MPVAAVVALAGRVQVEVDVGVAVGRDVGPDVGQLESVGALGPGEGLAVFDTARGGV